MNFSNLRPIPFSIERKIRTLPITGKTTFYSYLEKWDEELIKITVACKCYKGRNYYKQVAVNGIHSDSCYLKDIDYTYMSGYAVGWFEQGLYKNERWCDSRGWFVVNSKFVGPYAPVLNLEMLEDTQYKYSGYQYFKHEILQMLRLYEKYPCVEYLAKLGLNSIEDKSTILKKCSKEKAFCSWLIRNKENLLPGYYTETILKSYSEHKDLAELQSFLAFKKRLNAETFKSIRQEFAKDLEKFKAYIEKYNIGIFEYKDYLEACKDLGLDMSEYKNRFPHEFKRWHDIRIDEYATKKAMQAEKEKRKHYAKFKSIAKKYISLEMQKGQQFIVIIAQSPADLVNEGKFLHHCVGSMNYDQKFIREESLIFFIRNKQTPNIPFVTVEYSLKTRKVLQCYGDHDSKPSEDILHYVNKIWLPYANKTLKQIA